MTDLPYALPPARGMRVRPDHGGFTALLYPRWRVRPGFVLNMLVWQAVCVGGMMGLAAVGYLSPVMGGMGLSLTMGLFLFLALGFFEVRTFFPVEVSIVLPHLVWDGDRVPLMGIRCVARGSTLQVLNADGALRYELPNLHPEVAEWVVLTVEGYQEGQREDQAT